MRPQRIGLMVLIAFIASIPTPLAALSALSSTPPVLAQTSAAQKAQDLALEQTVLKSLLLVKADHLYEQGNQQLKAHQMKAALQSWQQALALYQHCGCRQGKGWTLHNLGWTYHSLGDYTNAIELYQQSLSILREIGDRQAEAQALGNLGKVYEILGQYEKAKELYQQSLSIWQRIGNRKRQGQLLESLSYAYYSLGDLSRAIEFSQQSLSIAQATGDRIGEAVALTTLATVHGDLGDSKQAINYAQQSLAIAQKMGDRSREARALNQLSVIYFQIGDYVKAIDYSKQTLTIVQKTKDRKAQGHALYKLGLALFKVGNFAEAEKYLRAAIQVWESLRLTLSDADQVSIFETQARAYNTLQQVLIAQNKTDIALEVAEAGRARAFVALLTKRLGSNPTKQLTPPPPTISQIKQIAKTHNATLIQYSMIYDWFQIQGISQYKESQLYLWVIKPSGEVMFRRVDLKPLWQQQHRSLTQIVFNSQSIANEFTQELTTSRIHPGAIALLILSTGSIIGIAIWCGRSLLTAKVIESSQTKKRLLVPAFLLLLAAGSSGLFVWMLYNQAIASNSRVDSSLTQLISSTRSSIGTSGRGLGLVAKDEKTNSRDRLKQLHQILIQPIVDLLPQDPNARIIFIPQNSLFLVPFPALQDANGKYLIEKHTILTAPSIQVLDLTHKQKQRLDSIDKVHLQSKDLIVGNPTMPSVPPQMGESPQQLPSLPGAEVEAKSIAKTLRTQAILGNQATKQSILQKLPNARIVHLATHGLLDDIRGLGSAIALAPSNKDNGLLTAEEILNLKLNAELVVLSACDTGRGRITGDGVVGLSRSLISAGVPSIIVSLWSVPDAPTASLMTEFYQNLQKNPNKALALRQAMLTTMKHHPNPRDWAAFTLIGEAE